MGCRIPTFLGLMTIVPIVFFSSIGDWWIPEEISQQKNTNKIYLNWRKRFRLFVVFLGKGIGSNVSEIYFIIWIEMWGWVLERGQFETQNNYLNWGVFDSLFFFVFSLSWFKIVSKFWRFVVQRWNSLNQIVLFGYWGFYNGEFLNRRVIWKFVKPYLPRMESFRQ